MHDGEAEIDAGLVRRLVATQFPRMATLPITAVRSAGTVNAIYQLGEQLCVRLPRVRRWADSLETEWQWLPRLAPGLTLEVPVPVAKGQPASGYPFTWAIYRWIGGSTYTDQLIADEYQAALDLAQFVTELRRTKLSADAPVGGRRPLTELDSVTRADIRAAADVIDGPAAMAAWESALKAPSWDGRPVWIHSDLLRPNLLVDKGRIRAVIDFGSAGAGDAATDIIPAWAVFGPAGRRAFRDALNVDDDMWNRARGIALHQAAALIPYYSVSNPEFAALGKRTVEEVIADTFTA